MALPPVLDHPVFTSALQGASVGICVVTRSGHTVLWANDAFSRACACGSAPVQGTLLRDRWPGYGDAAALFTASDPHARRLQELAVTPEDGPTGWWDVEVAPLGPDALMIQLTDRTTQVRLRLEAEALRNSADRLLSMFNHELRNPLTPAGLSVAMLLDDERVPEGVRGQVAMIRKNLQQHSAVLDELVAAGRIAFRTLRPNVAETDVRSVLQRVLRVSRPELESSCAVVDYEPLAGNTVALADADRLEQALRHVIRFVLRTLPAGRTIRIRSRDAEAMVTLSFAWPAENLDARRIETALAAGGTQERLPSSEQLGLAVARGMLELQGAVINAQEADNGVSIVVQLPASDATRRPSDAAAESVPPPLRRGAPLKILVVDDDITIRRMLQRLLQRDGHDVVAVETVAEAVREASSRRIQVLISDIGLPDGSGTGLLRQLKSIQPLVGIALTGHTTPEHRRAALSAGFTLHLEKPVDVGELREALATIAARTATTRESIHTE